MSAHTIAAPPRAYLVASDSVGNPGGGWWIRAALLLALGAAGCESPAAPVSCGPLPQVTVNVGETASVNACFNDANGDVLSYTVTASNPLVATASITGTAITVSAVAPGNATVFVTASDPEGLQGQQSFQVMVPNRAPQPRGTPPGIEVLVGETATVNAAQYFTEPDGQALTYSAMSSDAAVADVSVAGSDITVAAKAKGGATVTITATDPGGLSATQSFRITVPNRSPAPVGTIDHQTIEVGRSATIDAAAHFTDPDGDALTYAAAASDASVADVSVAGSDITVAAKAKGGAAVTITATDPGGLSATQSFRITVPNRSPAPVGTIAEQTIEVGRSATIDAAAHFTDPDGDALTYAAAASDASVADVSVAGSEITVAARAKGSTAVTITATDPGGLSATQSFRITVPNRSPAPVGTIAEQTIEVGRSATIDAAAHFTDPDGDALTYAATSSNSSVARVSVSGSTVTITGTGAGSATITVTARDPDGLTATQQVGITVSESNRAPRTLGSIPAQTLAVGETRAWAGPDYFEDPDGDALTFAAGTTNAAIVLAVVSGDAFSIAAVAPGSATITVTATDGDGLSASLSFPVTSQPSASVRITDVQPAVLIEGQPATISGSGFSSTSAGNAVLIDGLAAIVTAANSTRLSVIVPTSDCLPPRRAELRVTAGGISDARTVAVSPHAPEDIELPTLHYRYTYAGNGCLHLPGDASGGDYLIGVVSTAEHASFLTPVSMTSIVGDPTVLAASALAASPQRPMPAAVEAAPLASMPRPGERTALAGPAVPLGQQNADSGRDWDREAEMTERNLDLVRRLGPMPSSMARARQAQSVSSGDTLSLFMGSVPTCSSRERVRAVVRLVGNHTVWLDDLANPSGTFTDAELAGLDAFYGASVRDVHQSYFGGLSDIDGNGRVMILMTKEVNRQDIGGFVWFGDLYSSVACAASNQAEIFYGRVPDPDGLFGSASSKESTLDYYPSLLTHEIAHIVQGNAFVFGGARATVWEIEGGATLSEQLVANRLFGHGSGQNLGYSAYQRGSDWYRDWVDGLAAFFGWDPQSSRRVPNAPEECSWMDRPERGNDGPCKNAFRAVYDVPSMVLRYAMDRWGGDFPGGERALMRRLTQSPRAGLAALADVSGWRPEHILADFYIALWLDLNGGNAYGMATWDLDDIWSRLPGNARLAPYSSASAEFHGRWNIRAGSTFFLRWTPPGSRGPTSLSVRSANGADAPDSVAVWALRVR